MRQHARYRRAAFTLVELLMVITIIGILVGLLVPAVMFAMQSVKKRSIGIELQTIANAIDQYKTKYGDYPPDGSNAAIFQRHYRKIFSQMIASEFIILDAVANVSNGAPAGVMDPPEAIVFALGGFSSDPFHPFTGPGGPISLVPDSTPPAYQYNVDRSEPLYEFKDQQLSLKLLGDRTVSSDEEDLGFPADADAMPVYRPPYNKRCPFVYFDSRTYSFPATSSGASATFYNNYSTPNDTFGIARPYRSAKLNTSVKLDPSDPLKNVESYYTYMNDRSFQLISAGLDDHYGGLLFTPNPNSAAGPIFYIYPTGASLDLRTGIPVLGAKLRYNDIDPSTPSNVGKPQLDNVANFADGTLDDGLAN